MTQEHIASQQYVASFNPHCRIVERYKPRQISRNGKVESSIVPSLAAAGNSFSLSLISFLLSFALYLSLSSMTNTIGRPHKRIKDIFLSDKMKSQQIEK